MKTYFRLVSYAKPFGRFAIPYFIFSTLSIFFGLANFTLIIPLLNVLFGTIDFDASSQVQPAFQVSIAYFKEIFYYYFYQAIEVYGKVGALRFVCIVIILSVFLSNLFKYLASRIIENIRTYSVKNLRQAIFDKLTSLHLGYFSHQKKGDVMSRITTDVQEVENSVANTLTAIFKEPIALIGYFIVLFMISVKLTLFALLVIPIAGLIISSIVKKLKKATHEGQSYLASLLTTVDETLSGLRIIKAFNAVAYVRGKFDEENSAYAKKLRSITHKRELASPFSEFAGVSIVAGILLYGGSLVLQQSSELSASEFVGYIILFSQVLQPVKGITTGMSNIQRGIAAGKRVFQLIDVPQQILEKPQAYIIPSFEKNITFQDVSFKYENTEQYVLKNVSFSLEKGKTIALVGPSGGGKSTIADLIPRFYDVEGGEISIDGHNIQDCSLDSLRNLLGVVGQESILFHDTIFNNIAFGNKAATKEAVIEAAKVANAHQFIMETPNGYDTIIGDRGTKLSGGQRQRLSIARAVLKDPAILILDEATSALDNESEKLVQVALNHIMKNRTSLIIAHRLSTIQHADEILVIQNGQIVQQGTHQTLMADTNGLYNKLAKIQHTL